MKKILPFLALGMGILVVAAITIPPQKACGLKSSPLKTNMVTMPDSVRKIFQKACYDCHSNDGSSMAKSHVNFSSWDSYSSDKQASKASSICEVMQKAKMPPKGFTKNNPDRTPSEKEVKIVCDWAEKLQK